MYRSSSLESKELMALCGGERDFVTDEHCISKEYDDLESECSEDGKGGRGIRSSVSMEIYGLQREQHVYFSNQEYYRRLEELKSTHLRNMAELERMYISQVEWRHDGEDDGGLGGGRNTEARQSTSGPTRRLQRINSQEELDFHETSSGSDQSELCGEDGVGELAWTPSQERIFLRDILLSPEHMTTQKRFKLQNQVSRQIGARVRPNSKVTVPKPFQMMLREEERKRHKVLTRSEMELENTLLKRELDELRECQKKFRASPVPAHIHLPLYGAISRRSNQRSNGSRRNNSNRDAKSSQASAAVSPQPFHFLEREKRKKEAKIVEELGNFGQKVERQAFRARPMPSSVYGNRHKAGGKTACRHPQFETICTLGREATEGQSDPSSDQEPDVHQSDASADSCGPQRCPSSKPVKKIQLSIQLVKDPFKAAAAAACNIFSPQQPGGPQLLLGNKSDYISA